MHYPNLHYYTEHMSAQRGGVDLFWGSLLVLHVGPVYRSCCHGKHVAMETHCILTTWF